MLKDTSGMGDLLRLDSLVINTAFLKVRGIDREELRRQCRSLALPTPKNSSALQEALGQTFESLCEQQPIGRRLFRQFLLASNRQCAATAEFLEELNSWSFAEEEAREKVKQSILAKFCQPESTSFLSYLTGHDADRCKRLPDMNSNDVMMAQMREATRDFLKGEPFSDYLNSPFFYRFLQWKEYEKQKISDKYFYKFRTLGKGGFGEVGTRTP